MKKIFIYGIIALLTLSIVYSDEIKTKNQEVPDKGKATPEYVPDEILVKFKTGVSPQKIESIFQEFNVSQISEIKKLRVRRLKIPNDEVLEMVEKFKKNPFVEFVEPNYLVHASFVPNDPFYFFQWHFNNPAFGGIHMESAWDVTTGDPGIIVAVVDTGVAFENFPGPGFWHLDTYNAFGGSGSSWWCGVSSALPSWTALHGGSSTPPGYGDSWKQYLQHSFDLTSVTGTVTFSYQYKLDIERGFDFFYIEVSDNNGQSWTTLKTYTNGPGPPGRADVDWTLDSVDLTSHIGNNVLIRFRFNSDETFSDEDGNFNSDGAVYIDEIRLEDSSGTLFFDDAESGAGLWETTEFIQAPDLAGTSFVTGFDFVNSDTHPNDDNSHGTHVSGTVAQTTDNSLGVAGVAFSTSIMPVKVLNAAGTGTSTMVADGIIFATDNGANIISMSLGSASPSSTIETAVDYAFDNNVTVIAACGNSNSNGCDYPAAFTNVISVGATQYDETKAPYSSFGPNLDLVAPGGNTGVDQNGDGFADGVLQQTFDDTPVDFAYWFFQGTSMATPHISGVAALLLAINSSLTPTDVKNVLITTTEDLGSSGRDDTFGWGLVNASAAVNSIVPESAELISITLLGFPVDFGNLDTNTINSSAIGNAIGSYIIQIDPVTTVNVDIFKKGDNFISGATILDIGNVVYDDDNVLQGDADATNPETILTNSYGITPYFLNIVPGTSENIYYWISIPESQKAGDYSTTIYVKAVESNQGGNAWTTKTSMPTVRAALTSSAVAGKIYAIGGISSGTSSQPTSFVEEYDVASDSWSSKAPMPTARWKLTSSVVAGKIYAIGGGDSGNQCVPTGVVEEYNPTTDTWTAKNSMPTPRWGAASGVITGKIYAVGGSRLCPHISINPSAALEVYDPSTNTWTAKTPMSTPRWDLAVAVVNGKLYAIGGWDPNSESVLSIVEEYDPATNTWSTKSPMPTGRTGLTAAVINNKIYAIGGGNTKFLGSQIGIFHSVNEEYNPLTDTWTTKSPMPTPREGLASSMVNDKIYAIGGGNSSFLSTNEEYTIPGLE